MSQPHANFTCSRSARLREHAPLVRKIAGRLSARTPASVDVDELVQAGMIGLNEALSRYDSELGAGFDTYASRRIEGAMLDSLRATDTLTRAARQRQRGIKAAVQRLEHRLLRAPRAQEVANELGWSLSEFHHSMVAAGVGDLRHDDQEIEDLPTTVSAALTDFDDGCAVHDEHADPLHALQQRQRHAALNEAFDALDDRERHLMQMIYERELDQRDAAASLGISAARVSQLHSMVVDKLRRRLRDW